ncbi:MAG: DnaD domain protein [Thermoflexales bacterium]|nr:DnaD domain protein [Thermoflexales bacterium]
MNLIEDYINKVLPEVDDLNEAKVTLAALQLLAQRVSPTASVSEQDVLNHPLVREGVSFPTLTVGAALRRAVGRGALLAAEIGGQMRYFADTEAARQLVEHVQHPEHAALSAHAIAQQLCDFIARMELIGAYVPGEEELRLVQDWLADGYTLEELLEGVRAATIVPRPAHTPPRTLSKCAPFITARPPRSPSAFYRFLHEPNQPAPPGVVAFRELTGRLPRSYEAMLIERAVALFGERNVVTMMQQMARENALSTEALLPRLQEREEAALALEHGHFGQEARLREALRLYESIFGLPPTAHIAEEMRLLLDEGNNDLDTWRAVFLYAAERGKRQWNYIKRLLREPSPNVFVPAPINEAAAFAFEEYRRRVNPRLDARVAQAINALAQTITEPARWQAAFDKAAEANALRWDYIRKVLSSEAKPARERSQVKPSRGRTYRRPQVEYTEAEREAARERARRRLAELEQESHDADQ